MCENRIIADIGAIISRFPDALSRSDEVGGAASTGLSLVSPDTPTAPIPRRATTPPETSLSCGPKVPPRVYRRPMPDESTWHGIVGAIRSRARIMYRRATGDFNSNHVERFPLLNHADSGEKTKNKMFTNPRSAGSCTGLTRQLSWTQWNTSVQRRPLIIHRLGMKLLAEGSWVKWGDRSLGVLICCVVVRWCSFYSSFFWGFVGG